MALECRQLSALSSGEITILNGYYTIQKQGIRLESNLYVGNRLSCEGTLLGVRMENNTPLRLGDYISMWLLGIRLDGLA